MLPAITLLLNKSVLSKPSIETSSNSATFAMVSLFFMEQGTVSDNDLSSNSIFPEINTAASNLNNVISSEGVNPSLGRAVLTSEKNSKSSIPSDIVQEVYERYL